MKQEYLISYSQQNKNIPVGILTYEQPQNIKEGFIQSYKFSSGNYTFIYDELWLENGFQLSPDLRLKKGIVYNHYKLPLAIQDILPDLWGREVLNSYLNRKLDDLDLLLGVDDELRLGALRISSLEKPDLFLGKSDDITIPKMIDLSKLKKITQKIENHQATIKEAKKLLGVGSSLGGSVPKFVVKKDNAYYLAKFKSKKDDVNTPIWEGVALTIAKNAGIQVPEHDVLKLSKEDNDFVLLVKRFDRDKFLNRIHFVPLRTLVGITDPNQNFSYEELAEVIFMNLSRENIKDPLEMWKRCLLNALIQNVDDHILNHGFLKTKEGWKLSPAYDIVPFLKPENFKRWPHSIAFTRNHFEPTLDNLLLLGKQSFNLKEDEMKEHINIIVQSISSWKMLAKEYGASSKEITMMKSCFENELIQESENMFNAKNIAKQTKSLKLNKL
jgi:serine/threonine-protein kinase HipA